MTHTLIASPATLREALYELSLAKDIPDATLLDDVVRRYPSYSEELTSFAIAIALDAIRGIGSKAQTEDTYNPNELTPVVSRALSRFENRLHEKKSQTNRASVAQPIAADAINPFASLAREEFRGFAQRIGANNVFAAKLRDRQIDPDTMSSGFQRRVAADLPASFDVVMAHFAAQQATTGRTQYFKADVKPTDGGRQTFEEAVRSSGLSEEQQQQLLAL